MNTALIEKNEKEIPRLEIFYMNYKLSTMMMGKNKCTILALSPAEYIYNGRNLFFLKKRSYGFCIAGSFDS